MHIDIFLNYSRHLGLIVTFSCCNLIPNKQREASFDAQLRRKWPSLRPWGHPLHGEEAVPPSISAAGKSRCCCQLTVTSFSPGPSSGAAHIQSWSPLFRNTLIDSPRGGFCDGSKSVRLTVKIAHHLEPWLSCSTCHSEHGCAGMSVVCWLSFFLVHTSDLVWWYRSPRFS